MRHLILLYLGVAKQKHTKMLQSKDITKIQEVKTFYKESWVQPEFFAKHLELFHFKQSSAIFNSVKISGVQYWELLKVLLILPFARVKNIQGLMTASHGPSISGEKDVYYRALENQKVDWRKLLLLFISRYLVIDKKSSGTVDDFKCLIFDDTDLPKSGRKIEGISKPFNHVTKQFAFGYKLLVAGYWNGSVFIPVDFSFHREQKESKKKYGLTKKERKAQKKTKRNKYLPVFKRFQELNKKKTDMVVSMFKRINRRSIQVDYILFDSWFTSMKLITELASVNTAVHVIGMYKYNSKITINGKEITINQLKKSRKKLSRSRVMKLYYAEYTGEINGIKVKIFITRRGTNGAWHTVLTTDTSLIFTKAMKIYSTRWAVEVFFKETKQLLGLGKCQSTNFDVQVAHTTIVMIQYLMLSLKHRMEAYETMGGMFKEVERQFIEHKVNERILALIGQILNVLELIVGNIDFIEVMDALIQNSDAFSFLERPPNYKHTYKVAA